MKLFFSLVFVARLLLSLILCEEPQCSKFHYEAQTLDKMIRMEVKVEAIEKEILKTNQLVLDSLEALKNEREIFKTERSDFNKKLSELNNILDDVKDMKKTPLTPTVAFKAHNPVDLNLKSGQTIVYSTNMLNEGEAYDNVTGIFTAPVAGTYLFTVHFCPKRSQNLYFGIVRDNAIHTGGWFFSSDNTCHAADAIMVLQLGQKVWVKCTYSTSIMIESQSTTPIYWNTFSGVLIHK